MNDFARVESRPKREALAVWFITYLRERSRKRLINKLQTQTKCRTRWAPRDVRRCAEACHVPERCVVPLFTSWHRLNTSRRGKLQEKFKHELAGLKRMLRQRVKRAGQRQSTARTACRYCTWRTHQYSDAEYLAHLSRCAGANGRLRAIELRPAKVVCLRPRCSRAPRRSCGRTPRRSTRSASAQRRMSSASPASASSRLAGCRNTAATSPNTAAASAWRRRRHRRRTSTAPRALLCTPRRATRPAAGGARRRAGACGVTPHARAAWAFYVDMGGGGGLASPPPAAYRARVAGPVVESQRVARTD